MKEVEVEECLLYHWILVVSGHESESESFKNVEQNKIIEEEDLPWRGVTGLTHAHILPGI